MGKGMVEGEIRQCIEQGGKLRGAFVVTIGAIENAEYLAFLRPSWKRGYYPLRTWGDKADRTYRDLDRLMLLVRNEFGWRGVIPVFARGDTDVALYRDISANSPSFTALLQRLSCDGSRPQPDD